MSLERISLLGERCEARYCNWRWPNEKAAEKYPVDRYLFPLMGNSVPVNICGLKSWSYNKAPLTQLKVSALPWRLPRNEAWHGLHNVFSSENPSYGEKN